MPREVSSTTPSRFAGSGAEEGGANTPGAEETAGRSPGPALQGRQHWLLRTARITAQMPKSMMMPLNEVVDGGGHIALKR